MVQSSPYKNIAKARVYTIDSDFSNQEEVFKDLQSKYGEENWDKEILFEFETTDKKYAYSVEQKYIDKYNAYKHGYNMDIGFGWNISERSGENNPMYGKVSGNASKVVVDGVLYSSVSEAGKVLNKNRNKKYLLIPLKKGIID